MQCKRGLFLLSKNSVFPTGCILTSQNTSCPKILVRKLLPPVSVKRFVVALGKHAVNALLQQRPAAEGRVGCEQRLCFFACVLHEREVCGEVCHVQRRETVLTAAEKVAGAALREVGARDFKAIIRLTEDFQPFPGGRALGLRRKRRSRTAAYRGRRGRAADAAATDRNGLHPRRP